MAEEQEQHETPRSHQRFSHSPTTGLVILIVVLALIILVVLFGPHINTGGTPVPLTPR